MAALTLFIMLGIQIPHTPIANAQIRITEILPNPKGKDKGWEWIELFNDSDSSISLENWQISNPKKSVKLGPATIPPKKHHTLEKLKITLRNKDEKIQIRNPQGYIVDQIEYAKAPEGLSFSEIFIKQAKNSSRWQWTVPTKNQPNPTFYEITGTILTEPSGDNFTIQADQDSATMSAAGTLTINATVTPLLKVFFKKDTHIKLLIDSQKNLLDYQIQNRQPHKNKPPTEKWLTPLSALTVALFITTLFYSWRYKSSEPLRHE